jgi:hypothetical protein
MSFERGKDVGSRVRFWGLVVFLLWLTHAAAYLAHEYAHSFVAWVLGYKANPLALNYGHLDWNNVLTLGDIDENVDYGPIFAVCRGALASLIAVAGVLFGNGGFYLVSRWFYARAKREGGDRWALFWFLFCMMNAGNLMSYVPTRTFATHADMATVEKGLGISPWWVAAVLGVPFLVAVWHFVARLLPEAMRHFFPDSRVEQVVLLVVSCSMIFAFYGAAGLVRYGAVSHWMSVVSVCVLLPLSVIVYWPRVGQ